MNIISKIFYRKADKEMNRIKRRSNIALKAVSNEHTLILKIERLLMANKNAAEIKKVIFDAKSIKSRFAGHIRQLIDHSALICETYYPHNKKIKNLTTSMEFETGMIEKYWNEVFLALDYADMKKVIPFYLKFLRKLRIRIEVVRDFELSLEEQIKAKKRAA